jgi:hypothetical protein
MILAKKLAEIDNEKSYQPGPVRTSVALGGEHKEDTGCCK